MRNSLFAFILVLISILGYAQNPYDLKHVNVDDGLSQSSVLSIAQDAKGFMWFGTRFGLNKYDSQRIEVYKQEKGNATSLSSSQYISSILCLKDGTLLIGTIRGLNKYNEGKNNFESYFHSQKDKKSISDNSINCIFQDREGRVWIGTNNGLNLLHTNGNYHFQNFLVNNKTPQQIYSIQQDHTGKLWLSTTSGLMCLEIKKNNFKFSYLKTISTEINKVNDNHVTSIVEDSERNLWIGTKQAGLICLNLLSGKTTNYQYSSLNANGISSNNIRKILIDTNGKLWIATLHGVSIYNPKTKSFTTLQNEPNNTNSLSQNSVYSIYQDNQNIIWIGTYYGSVNMVYPNYTPFKVFNVAKTPNGLSSNVVGAILEDQNNNLWVGTEGEGLNFYDKKNGTYKLFKNNPNDIKSLSSNLVKSIVKDKNNNIWVGTHLGGLNLFNPKTNTFIRYTNRKGDSSTISNDEITTMFEDSYGRFWVGTNGGLNNFNPTTRKFSRKHLNDLPVNSIFEDSKKNLWVATADGLYQLKNKGSQFIARHTRADEALRYNDITFIAETKNGLIILGTSRSGLFKLDPDRHRYSQISTKEGLPSNNIMGVMEDDKQNIWISTDNGLCKNNPQKNTFNIYNKKDGLPGNEFNYRTAIKSKEGKFLFGGLSGLISFSPNEITANTIVKPAIFTELRLFGKPVSIDESNKLLNCNISTCKSISFAFDQNVFTIDFTILNFLKSDKNTYAYKLEGFEKDWNYVSKPSASYTNLSPGRYTLLVRGSNNDGIWSTTISKLNIEVRPPIYRTWWAYIIYLGFVAGIFILLVRYLLIRAVLTKEKEINEHKLEFFTNISHEIRTPLTLIVGPLERLIENNQNEPQLTKELQPIKSNADRLMNLVTELLDFRKAESGKMDLKVSPGNIVKFCKEIFIAFQNMAILTQIDYSFTSESDTIEVYFDKVQMEKVLFNLLSNAFKFTPTNGKITFEIAQFGTQIIIKICDNGRGIPMEYQPNLFKIFYQANTNTTIGTGLGLSFSKSIVELHKGEISFKSTPQTKNTAGSTCFSISLKTGKEHFNESDFINNYIYYDDVVNYNVPEIAQTPAVENAEIDQEKKNFNILLVEDNDEVRTFIKNSLANIYNVYESSNGLKGFENAVEIIPDLIISDVMMPVMDGLELCRKLKTDERTSHIPVILLTARSAYIHQVNGFENGADAYIMKPFNLKILELNIHNLLKARETIRRKFAQVINLQPNNLIVNSTEQKFLTKIIQIVEDHIADPDFDVPTLSSEIGMSQPVLYKKLRALTDLSVNDFIKSLRIKRAAQLLKQNFGNISEVAYAVGFNDRKYFSLEFKKHFGKSPSEFMQEEKE